MLARRGAGLVELLVALVLAAIVLAAAARSTLVQQRTAARLAATSRLEAQLRAGRAAIAADLGSASRDDVVASESNDSTLQLRGVVANGLACGSAVGAVTLAPPDRAVMATGGVASIPRAGDSVWWRTGEGGGEWRGARATAVASARVACAGLSPDLRPSYRVTLDVGDNIAGLAPVRITRQLRYTVYRAGDGTSQLGLAEWSEAAHAMGGPQPLAGPFERRGSGPRTGFRYFDGAGREGVAAIAVRVRLTLASRDALSASALVDSVDVTLARGAGRP